MGTATRNNDRMDRILAAVEKQSGEFAALMAKHNDLLDKYSVMADELASVKAELQALKLESRNSQPPRGLQF